MTPETSESASSASPAPIAVAPPPIFCPVPGCKRNGPDAIPFVTLAARGSHSRRVHGVVSIAMSKKRPLGGTLSCPYPECANREPYVSLAGRETHLRVHHGALLSQKPEAKRTRRDRLFKRLVTHGFGDADDAGAIVPTPALPDMPSHAAKIRPLTYGEWKYIWRRLLYCVNGPWAREINANPAVLRDEIERMCRTNFADRRRDRSRENARA